MKKYLLIAFLSTAISLLAETKVLVFAGSTREDSYNKKLALEAAQIAREIGAKVTVIDLKDFPMPFYDADLETKQGLPKNAKRFRDLMIASDAIVIASPEYNSSISAILKNALDWASRSEEGGSSRDAFKGKKFAIVSASPGKSGGARGLVHLRSIIEDIGGEVVQQQVTVPRSYESGALESASVKKELRNELQKMIESKEVYNQG